MKMKNTFLNKINKIFMLAFVGIILLCSFVGISHFSQKNSKNGQNLTLFAEELDKETKIFDDGQTLDSKLWNALKTFYNNNRTEGMPSIPVYEGEQYLTIDLFKNFPLNVLNLSNKNIGSINNLRYFDLSAFEKIDLSYNALSYIGNEFAKLNNLKSLNLSNNVLTNFSYDILNETCLSNFEELDISNNNIVSCDLTGFTISSIKATNNRITKNSLKLPSADLNVDLSFNFIDEIFENKANISYGVQGVKNNEKYAVGQKIGFYGLDGVDSIEIYFVDKENPQNETLVKALNANETYIFPLGNYSVKIANLDDIKFYIAPKAPEIKMFRGESEIELTHVITSPVTIKFCGDENARFVYKINAGNLLDGDEVNIDKPDTIQIVVYQIVDGYVSLPTTFYLEYHKTFGLGLVVVIAGIAIFVAVFVVVMKYLPKIMQFKLGESNKNNKENLD